MSIVSVVGRDSRRPPRRRVVELAEPPVELPAAGSGGGASMRSSRSQLSSSFSATVRRCGSFTPDASRTSTVDSSSGSSSSSSTNSRQRSSNAMRDEISSRTSMRGGSPISIGNSVRMRCANECNVQIAAASRSSSAARHRARTTSVRRGVVGRAAAARARMRSRSSAAAFSVNVIAAIAASARADRTVGGHERDDPVDERLGLARCPRRPRRTASRRARCGSRRARARRRVRRRARVGRSHVVARPPALSAARARRGSRKPASSGAANLRSHSRQRSVVPMPSGSQKRHSMNGVGAGSAGRAGTLPLSMPSTIVRSVVANTLVDRGVDVVADALVPAPADEPVVRLDLGVGRAVRGARRVRVHRQLQVRARRDRVVVARATCT